LRTFLVAVLLAGCSRGAEVDIVVQIASDVEVARVVEVGVSEDSTITWAALTPAARAALDRRLLNLTYHASRSEGSAAIAVYFRDAVPSTVGASEFQTVELRPGRASQVSLTVRRVDPMMQDMSIDAGTVDLTGDDIGIDGGGPSTCPLAGVLDCDGFERTTLLGATWAGSFIDNAAMTLDSSRAYRGQKSLHIVIVAPDGGTNVFGGAELVWAQSSNPLWIRAFVYMPLLTRNNWTAALFRASSANGAQVLGWENPSGFLWSDNNNYGPVRPPTAVSTTPLPVDRWSCVEWLVENGFGQDAAVPGRTRVFVDGVELTALDLMGLEANPPLGTLYVGSQATISEGRAPLEYWIDEIAIDDQRVGCAR
jgi:hypothetical protein